MANEKLIRVVWCGVYGNFCLRTREMYAIDSNGPRCRVTHVLVYIPRDMLQCLVQIDAVTPITNTVTPLVPETSIPIDRCSCPNLDCHDHTLATPSTGSAVIILPCSYYV